MKQYREARESLTNDTILLFRLGDFYELFEEDAKRGAVILGITLTKRHEMPMAGIPFHAAEGYLSKLLAQGLKVAICEQLEVPRPGKLVKRGITRILTPGTVLEERQLEAGQNHFILALDVDKETLAERIDRRCVAMVEAGLIGEYRAQRSRGERGGAGVGRG